MEKQWQVYILRCADGSFYTGITDNLLHRVQVHNNGKGAKYTRGRRPVTVLYSESCADHSAALKREIAIKRLTRAEKCNLCGIEASGLIRGK